MRVPDAPSLHQVRAARDRIAGIALRTPLVRLEADAPAEVFLKLENLQPIGSFKLRGATNALLSLPAEQLGRGVYTASAGNMAQGVAWGARRLGVPCRVVVPEHAPEAKLRAILRLGARIEKAPFDEWWSIIAGGGKPGTTETFLHPFADTDVMAGNGTIAIEILEDLPDVDTVVVPFGGGGLACGIASAFREAAPRVKVLACEVETATPFAAALEAGQPVPSPYEPSFVDGIGSRGVLPEMWPLACTLLAGSVVSSLNEIAAAVRLLVERARVVAEGAGAASVAAALAGRAGNGRVACIVSGGNIDTHKLAQILSGAMPNR